jgi:hypothetical protein
MFNPISKRTHSTRALSIIKLSKTAFTITRLSITVLSKTTLNTRVLSKTILSITTLKQPHGQLLKLNGTPVSLARKYQTTVEVPNTLAYYGTELITTVIFL